MSVDLMRGSLLRRRPSTRTLWLLALFAVVLYFTVIPVATVLWGSVRTAPPGAGGEWTLDNFSKVVSPRFGTAVRNSFIFAIGSSVIAMILGGYLAWVTERTDTPFRRFIYAFVLVPLIVPGILTTIAWSLILNPRIGLANQAVHALGFEGSPFNGFSMWGMIWVDAMDSITLPFLLLAAAFRGMDPSLEEASTTSGGTNAKTLRHVTLPLMTPAVLATALIVFIKTIDSFEVPAVLGIPEGITVFATEVWLMLRKPPVDQNAAAAAAVFYVLVAMIALAIYYRATRLSERFATITGKGFKPKRMRLGRLRYVHAAVALFILTISVILPFLVMAYTSFLPYFQVPSAEAFSSMDFDSYMFVLNDSRVRRSLVNNLIAGLSASALVMLLGALISWVVIRTNVRGRRLLDAVSFAPIAIPGMVIGFAVLWFYLAVPVPIYATIWILAVAYVGAYLPYALRATHAVLSQIGVELEEASATSGATFRRTFVYIILPLVSTGLLVGFIFTLSKTFKGLSIPILLAGPGTEVLPTLVFNLYEQARFPELNALGILMFLFLLGLSVIAQRLARRIGFKDVEAKSLM